MDFSKIDREDHQVLARRILLEAVRLQITDREAFHKLRNRMVKVDRSVIFHNLYFIKAYEDLVASGEIPEHHELMGLIKKRSVRTMSGVAPVTVLTKAWPCPGKCVYCPTDVRMPKSYLASQPAAARGLRQQFDPYKQVVVRLRALEMTGHEVSKVELRIIGGTWSSYEKNYQLWFVKRCLEAMNDWGGNKVRGERREMREGGMTLLVLDEVVGKERIVLDEEFEVEVKRNETAEVRCIGINIETRPDNIDVEEIERLRKMGVTKVEMGVQTTSEYVQALTLRGHDLAEVKRATRLLKDAGFKVSYHMMPNLPGSNPEQDVRDFEVLFSDSDYCPDYVKVYPCVVIPGTILASWNKKGYGKIFNFQFSIFNQGSKSNDQWSVPKGKFEPYSDEVLIDVLIRAKRWVPEWCRIDRLMRDIPKEEIQDGSKMSNIRQVVQKKLKEQREKSKERECRCIRCREIGDLVSDTADVELVERRYRASGGTEVFLSYEDRKLDKLLGLLRLRLRDEELSIDGFPELDGCALVREIHVYGQQTAVSRQSSAYSSQHVGYGRLLMAAAEERAREAGYEKIAVIAGIGTREYYRKLGYNLVGTYMVKGL